MSRDWLKLFDRHHDTLMSYVHDGWHQGREIVCDLAEELPVEDWPPWLKGFLIWAARDGARARRDGRKRKARNPYANVERDEIIGRAVNAITEVCGCKATRNPVAKEEKESGCSIVSNALKKLEVRMGERRVEAIWLETKHGTSHLIDRPLKRVVPSGRTPSTRAVLIQLRRLALPPAGLWARSAAGLVASRGRHQHIAPTTMVSFLASFLPRKDRKSAPRAEPFLVAGTAPSTALVPLSTPLATPVATPETTPLATLETTPERTPTSTLIPVPEPAPAPTYVIRNRNAGTVVGLSRQPVLMATPWTHAADLLEFLMEDDALVGQVATEKALRAYYLAACRQKGIRPFRWLAVLRQLNALLRRIYGSAYRKSYRNIYEAGRLRKRRVYRVPTVEDLAQSAHQDAAVVERAEEKRRRA